MTESNPPPRIASFGEAIIRLTPPSLRRIEQTSQLDMWVGGAELNTAIALARLGAYPTWISLLPDNALGRVALMHARAHGVDVSGVQVRGNARMGLFFVEVGHGIRPSQTIYDRAGSAFAELKPGEFNWQRLLKDAHAFHTTGITANLSPECREETAHALDEARAQKCLTSFDLNFRALLTSPSEARATVEDLASSIDLLFASSGDAKAVFGYTGSASEIANRLQDHLKIPQVVASTRTEEQGFAQSRQFAYVGETRAEITRRVGPVLDPLGSGDAFAAGFLYGLLQSGVCRGLELGAGLASIKQSIVGDVAVVAAGDIELAPTDTAPITLR
jgi:2-dehydro-3-deoxygluconokinase